MFPPRNWFLLFGKIVSGFSSLQIPSQILTHLWFYRHYNCDLYVNCNVLIKWWFMGVLPCNIASVVVVLLSAIRKNCQDDEFLTLIEAFGKWKLYQFVVCHLSHRIYDQLFVFSVAQRDARPNVWFECQLCNASGQYSSRICNSCNGEGWLHYDLYSISRNTWYFFINLN